jgi:AmmeMemoRadiSam system protein B/AmmeMemoRadiSam system protein A
MTQEKIRESVIAGSWYPGHPETLKKQIGEYLDEAPPTPLGGELVGLIVPHAGYMYSGGIAAHAYKLLLQQSFDRVLILAPSHRAHFQGASVYRLGGYRTPLGIVPLDQDLIESLFRQSSLFHYVPGAESQEHSLEIQLPFLQVVLREFRLTPILMGDQSFESSQKLAEAIARGCKGNRVLLIASTDLSHFHPYKEAKHLDQVVLDRVAVFDPAGLSKDLEKGLCEACGGGPMVALMLAARKLGANKAKVLQYANSGDVTGDTHGVVGYMAAAVVDNPGKREEDASSNRQTAGIDLGLSSEEKQTLREIALQAIRSKCLKAPMPEIPVSSPKLKEPRGAFVSLHTEGDLRGCIGMIEGFGPLHQTVKDMAIQAAFSDPRFCPIEPHEFDKLDLEISVLTPLERIKDSSQIEIGKHGLLIRKKFHSGLLLPQVATEHGWDRYQFLEWTCRKASLPPHAWKDRDAEIYVFSADIF